MISAFSLPVLWVLVKLGDVCEIERGVTFPSEAQTDQSSEKNIACLRTTNVQEQVNWKNLIYIPRSYVQNENKLIRQSDILISIANSKELVGKVSFVDEVKLEAAFGGFISVIRAVDFVDPYYLYSFLRAKGTQEKLRSVSNQTTNIANLTTKEIIQLPIPLPSLPEQRRIAAILRQADMLRQWRLETDKKIEKLQKSLFIRMFGDPYENPKGWKTVSVESLKRSDKPVIRTGPFGSSLKKHEYTQDGVPVWGIDNVKPNKFVEHSSLFISEAKFRELGNYIVEDGDILISRAGTTGRMCVAHPKHTPSIIGTNLLRLSFDQEKIVPEFFTTMFTFFSDRVARSLRASGETDAYSFINSKDLKSLQIPLPDMMLQSDFLERLIVIKDISTDQVLSQNKLGSLMQSLLARAFTGEQTASWREKHKEELQLAAVERDKKLGLRGEVATVKDAEEGRLTPEEEEQLRQALGQFAVNVKKLVEPTQQSMLESVKALSVVYQDIVEPLLQNIRQSMQATASVLLEKIQPISRENFLHYIDNLHVPQEKRAIIETLDTTTIQVLKLAGTYPAYFTADDLEAGELGGITTLQAETSLRTLQALGFVKLVQIDGLLRYRLTDEDDYTNLPSSLQL